MLDSLASWGELMAGIVRRRGRLFARFFPNYRTLPRLVIAFALVIALTALGVFAYRSIAYCASEIKRVGGGCVGITDGTDGPVFGAGTAEALRLVGEENSRLPADPAGRDIVSIAYVVPIAPPGTDDAYASRMSGDVMGVAVAQRQANRTNRFGDRPLIRVLVVNVGDSAEPSLEPVEKLIEMTKAGPGENRVMAVAVSGKSLDPLTGAKSTTWQSYSPTLSRPTYSYA